MSGCERCSVCERVCLGQRGGGLCCFCQCCLCHWCWWWRCCCYWCSSTSSSMDIPSHAFVGQVEEVDVVEMSSVGLLFPPESRLPARAVTANRAHIAVSVWYSDSDVRAYISRPGGRGNPTSLRTLCRHCFTSPWVQGVVRDRTRSTIVFPDTYISLRKLHWSTGMIATAPISLHATRPRAPLVAHCICIGIPATAGDRVLLPPLPRRK